MKGFSGSWEGMFLIICLSSDLCSLCCVSGVPLPAERVVDEQASRKFHKELLLAQCSRVRLTLTLKGCEESTAALWRYTHITDFSHDHGHESHAETSATECKVDRED